MKQKTVQQVQIPELQELQRRLEDAEETINAIRLGLVDGIVVVGPQGEQVYSLSGAELPYRQLVEKMREGVATISPEGTILYCNQSFADLLRIPLERAIGSVMESFISPKHRRGFSSSLKSTKESITGEFVLMTAEHTQVMVLMSFTRQDHVGGSVSIIATDLTERLNAEEALRRAHESLEERVRERTQELAGEITERLKVENELRQLNDHLEERVQERTARLETANQELEAFSYTISHDLRAPLRAINGFLAILKEDLGDRLGEEELQHFGKLLANAADMNEMIDKLLEFSRLGRVDLHSVEFDMRALVEDTVRSSQDLEQKPVDVEIKHLEPAYGDRGLISHVVRNLISNALKFSEGKEYPQITIGSMQQNGQTVFYVKDNGVGFDMEHSANLFGVFHRLHDRSQFEGTGVGLAISRRIIERHGGRIWAEAETDKGATFYFSLPTPAGVATV